MCVSHMRNNYGQICEKDAEKRCLLRFDLNICKVLDDVTSDGMLFHVFATATGKAWLPIVQNRVDGTAIAHVEHSHCRPGIYVSIL